VEIAGVLLWTSASHFCCRDCAEVAVEFCPDFCCGDCAEVAVDFRLTFLLWNSREALPWGFDPYFCCRVSGRLCANSGAGCGCGNAAATSAEICGRLWLWKCCRYLRGNLWQVVAVEMSRISVWNFFLIFAVDWLTARAFLSRNLNATSRPIYVGGKTKQLF
jgi:hypothetical protein